jgi:hypothetical protein
MRGRDVENTTVFIINSLIKWRDKIENRKKKKEKRVLFLTLLVNLILNDANLY